MLCRLTRTDYNASSYNDIIATYPELIYCNIKEHDEYFIDECDQQDVNSYCTIDISDLDDILAISHVTDHNVMIGERPSWDTAQQPYEHIITIVDDSMYY